METAGKKIGLALGGGGSLGSYELGVWEACRELSIKPDIIVGTSIGALIGAFWAADKFETGAALWRDESPDKVLKDGLNFDWSALVKTFKQDRQRIVTFTKRYIKNKGADISPFIDLIRSSISAAEIKAAKPRFGVVAVSLPLLKQHNVILADVPDDEVHEWLFASSAIWPLFPVRVIKGKTYIDGGYKDTIPIKFAFDLGATEVISVNLFYNINWHPLLNRRADVINIEPSWNLGMSFNFSQAVIDRNRKLGYNDAMKKLGPLIGFRYTFHDDSHLAGLSLEFSDMFATTFPTLVPSAHRHLKKHTRNALIEEHLFIRGLEVLAETLGIDPTPTYRIEELAHYAYDTLAAHFDNRAMVQIFKKIRSGKQLSSNDEKTSLEAIKYVLEKEYHDKAALLWTSKKAKYALTYTMLRLINKRFVAKSVNTTGGNV